MELSSSARVQALQALLEPRSAVAQPTSLDDIARRLQDASIPEAIALGFSFAGPTDSTGERRVHAWPAAGLPDGALTLMLSPAGGHRALLWHDYREDALRLWIDARAVALPADAHGAPLAEPPGGWADERYFSIDLIAPDHPAQDWSRPSGRGQIRGLLVCDALARREWAVQPEDHEHWTAPLLRVSEGRLRLYADLAASKAGQPAREWPVGG